MKIFGLVFLATCSVALADIQSVYQILRQNAADRSPDIAVAEATYRQKSSQAYTSLARWLPRLDLQLSEVSSIDYSLLTSGALPASALPPGINLNPQEVTLGSWALRATVPLYRRSVHLGLLQSNREERLAREQLNGLGSELDWKLRQYLGNYLLECYRVATIGTSLEAAKSNLRESRLRFQLGQRTRIDMLRAEANVVNLESKKLGYDQQKSADRSALREYTSLSEQGLADTGLDALLSAEIEIGKVIDTFTVVSSLRHSMEVYLGQDEPSKHTVAERLASSNPLYRTILAEESLSEARAATVMAQDWPELSLQGSLTKQDPSWGNLFNGQDVGHSVSLVLTVPIFIGGSFFSTASEKNSLELAARLKREKDLIVLRNDVENQRLQIWTLEKTVDSLRLNTQQNQQLVELGQKSYDLGKTTFVELLTSQNDWIESKVNLAKAKIDSSVLIYRLAANLGVSQQ